MQILTKYIVWTISILLVSNFILMVLRAKKQTSKKKRWHFWVSDWVELIRLKKEKSCLLQTEHAYNMSWFTWLYLNDTLHQVLLGQGVPAVYNLLQHSRKNNLWRQTRGRTVGGGQVAPGDHQRPLADDEPSFRISNIQEHLFNSVWHSVT